MKTKPSTSTKKAPAKKPAAKKKTSAPPPPKPPEIDKREQGELIDALAGDITVLESIQQSKLACMEYNEAVVALRKAKAALESREAKRASQGVQGTDKPHAG